MSRGMDTGTGRCERPRGSGRAPGASGAPSGRLRLALSLALVAGVLLACGQGSAITLPKAPASALTLSIWISPDPDGKHVTVSLGITDTSGKNVNLRHGQQVTCNGLTFPDGQTGGSSDSSVPDIRQLALAPAPPGGDYTFVYTDEQGQQTTLVVPNLPVQLLAPRAGDVVPIPQSASRFVGTPATTPTPGLRAPDLIASLVVRYTLPPLPSLSVAHVSAYAEAPCPAERECGFIRVYTTIRQAEAAGPQTVTITDLALPLGSGFESFQPGPGAIGLSSYIQWDAVDSGFAGAHLRVDSVADVQITWTRG